MKNNRGKVLVIGLDGATLDLLQPLMAEGRMPFLKEVVSRGTWGELYTTYPPVTAPAWASFMTGKNPGKHGIYEFLYRRRDTFQQNPVNARMLGSKTLWTLLSEAGLRVGLINVPLTYPPFAVNGFMIGDFLTPAGERDFAYPVELVAELEERFGNYPLYHKQVYTKGGVEKVLAELDYILEYRAKTAKYLMEKYPWDFFMLHIDGTDRIQHEIWHIIDQSHPQHNRIEAVRFREAALGFYQKVDEVARDLVRQAEEGTTVILMSDHGFGPIYRFVNFNVWLMQQGFLKLKRDPLTLLKAAIFKLGLTPAFGYRLAMRLGFARLRLAQGVSSRTTILRFLDRIFLSLGNVDWSRSKVYSQGNYGQLYINLKGREPHGTVKQGREYEELREELIKKLYALIDPATGEKVVERVFKREELYQGPQLERASDVCFLLRSGYKALGTLEFTSQKLVEPAFGNSGDHRMEGFVALTGSVVREGDRLEGAQIIDLAPTILYLLGCSIPPDMDGKVLVSALKPEYVAQNQIQQAKVTSEREVLEEAYTPEQSEEIKSRLKGLGYWG